MEQPRISNKKLIYLITIIKTQQNILEYGPTQEDLRRLDHFKQIVEDIKKLDPKSKNFEIDKASYEQILSEEIDSINPINYINLIICKYPLLKDCIHLITERFHDDSLYFLRKTIKYNEYQLKAQQLFDYYQQITQQPTTTPISPTVSAQHKEPQEIIEQITEIKPLEKEKKNNEIKFTASTYKGLMYDYQAFLDCQNRNINCNVNDPFINVEITMFDEDGKRLISHNPNMPLPLPIFLDDNGTIKKEIFLPSSKRPFMVNNGDTELFQQQLAYLAIKFYNNIKNGYNKTFMNYLIGENVIQKEDNTYTHGENSCKPLLEKYFQLWNIPENEYKVQEPIAKPEEPQEPKIGWFAKLRAGITAITNNITNFFKNIYRYVFG